TRLGTPATFHAARSFAAAPRQTAVPTTPVPPLRLPPSPRTHARPGSGYTTTDTTPMETPYLAACCRSSAARERLRLSPGTHARCPNAPSRPPRRDTARLDLLTIQDD